jgi:hypothetical protein
VERHLRVRRDGLEELLHELGLEVGDPLAGKRHVVGEKRAARQVDRDLGQGLVHRHRRRGEPRDARPPAQGLVDRLPERDADIFNRVVQVHVHVAARLDDQVHQGMPAEEHQHVVEESHGRPDVGLSLAVERQGKLDRRLAGLAANLGGTVALGHVALPPETKTCGTAKSAKIAKNNTL